MNPTPKQALADLEKNKGRPLYYLYGDEPFKINEFVEKAAKIMFGGASDLTFCVDRIDGSTATGSDVLDAIQSMGLFSGDLESRKRLVIVRQAHLLKEVDRLAEVVMPAPKESPWGDSLLLLVADALDGRRKFHQWLKKEGLAFEFKPARDAELAQWVQYLGKKTGATISTDAAELLAVLSEGSLYRLAHEIEKAWLYAGAQSGAQINGAVVSAVTSGQVAHEMIELVRAVLEAKRARALLLAEKLVRASEDALGFVGFLTWAIKNPGRGSFVGQIVGGVPRIRRMVQGLVELDLRLKSTGADANALVEQFVIEQTVEQTV